MMDYGKIIYLTAKENLFILMVTIIMDNGLKEKQKDMGNSFKHLKNMKEIGFKAKRMDKANKQTCKENIKEIILKAKNKDKESLFGIMAVVIMANGKTIFSMAKVLIFGQMVKNTLDNG
jgi:hypothetical protein